MATHFVAKHSLHTKHIDPALQQVFIEMVFGMEHMHFRLNFRHEALLFAAVSVRQATYTMRDYPPMLGK